MTELAYPFTVRPLMPEEGGGWLVEFPDLPGCMADGETPEEAMREAGDALHSWLETARTHGDPIPPPSSPDVAGYSGKWVLRTPRSLHKRLADRAKAEGVSLNMLAVSLLAEGLGERSRDGRRDA
jgi:antitoxin HicB